jgi:plastocyanin
MPFSGISRDRSPNLVISGRPLLNFRGTYADKLYVKLLRHRLVPLLLVSTFQVQAGEVEGTVVIKHKLTRKAVTPAAAYQRGVAVELGKDSFRGDPLAYERSHVVIFIDADLPARPATATLEQKNRRFEPDLVIVPVGSTVSFPNSDPIFHNVFSLSKQKAFDLGNYPKGQTRAVTFNKPGVVLVNCHLHSNMAASIVVTPNQYVVRPDGNGRFAFHDVPAGRYSFVAWHKTAGYFRQMVTISDRNANVEFVIPLDEHGRMLPAESASR